jgi:hypothetical protein
MLHALRERELTGTRTFKKSGLMKSTSHTPGEPLGSFGVMYDVIFKWKPNSHTSTWTQKRWGTHDLLCNHETLQEATRDEARAWAEYEAYEVWDKRRKEIEALKCAHLA